MNENWPRWIYASIVKHFKSHTLLSGLQIALPNEDLSAFDKNRDIFELRIYGPDTTQGTVDDPIWRYTVGVLCKEHRSKDDQYAVQRNQGKFMMAFTGICVRKYGDGAEDDSSYLGTLQVEEPVDSDLMLSLDEPERLDISTLNAKYKIVF
jgi:hypothetical protein